MLSIEEIGFDHDMKKAYHFSEMSKLLTQLSQYRIFFYSNFHQIIHLRFHKLARFFDKKTNPKEFQKRSITYEEGKRKHLQFYQERFKNRLVRVRDYAREFLEELETDV